MATQGTARGSTLRHPDALLALAALATAAHAGDADAADKSAPKAAKPPKAPKVDDCGYCVVDMMPEPATCTSFADGIEAQASIAADGSINFRVTPRGQDYGEGDGATLDPAARPAVIHGTLASASPAATAPPWIFLVQPEPKTQVVGLVLAGTCNGAHGGAQLEAHWQGNLQTEGNLNVVVLPSAAPAPVTPPSPAGAKP